MKSRSALQFVVIIGIANFFADFTYEGGRGVVGPFLGSLGASAAIVGFVAGLGELMGYGLRSISGYFAGKSHRHWAFAVRRLCRQHARSSGARARNAVAARCHTGDSGTDGERYPQADCGSNAFVRR